MGRHYFLITEKASLEVAKSKETHLTAICINVPIRFHCSLKVPGVVLSRFQDFLHGAQRGIKNIAGKPKQLIKKQINQK